MGPFNIVWEGLLKFHQCPFQASNNWSCNSVAKWLKEIRWPSGTGYKKQPIVGVNWFVRRATLGIVARMADQCVVSLAFDNT